MTSAQMLQESRGKMTVSSEAIIAGGGPTVTYYSQTAGLQIAVNMQNPAFPNNPKEIMTVLIAFTPTINAGMAKWGQLITNNPIMIEHLEERRRGHMAGGGKSDVLTPEEFASISIPVELQVKELKRELERKNKLIEELSKSELAQGEGGVVPIAVESVPEQSEVTQKRRLGSGRLTLDKLRKMQQKA